MIVCPLCEHPQEHGNACDVCGRELVAPAPVNTTRDLLPELEPTRTAAPGNLAVERMPELEEHRAHAVTVQAAGMAELERTALPDGGLAATSAMPEKENTHYPSDGQRTPRPTTLVCRYCGSSQATGILCDKCGNKLPVPFKELATNNELEPTIECRECGVKGLPGRRCLACGVYIRIPEQ